MRTLRLLLCAVLMGTFALAPVACSKDEKSDDDGKKKKKKDKDKDDDDDDDKPKKKKPKGVEVPGITGFMVPAGGTYKHNELKLGEKTLLFETYNYMIADFPRDELRKKFTKVLEDAGWKVTADDKSGYMCSKDGTTVKAMFGEAGDTETKINVFPPK